MYLDMNYVLPDLMQKIRVIQENNATRKVMKGWLKFGEENGLQMQQGEMADITPNTPVETMLQMLTNQITAMTQELQLPAEQQSHEFLKNKYNQLVKLHKRGVELGVINNKQHNLNDMLDYHPDVKSYVLNNVPLLANDEMKESEEFRNLPEALQQIKLSLYPSRGHVTSDTLKRLEQYLYREITLGMRGDTITHKDLQDIKLKAFNIINDEVPIAKKEVKTLKHEIDLIVDRLGYSLIAPVSGVEEMKETFKENNRMLNDNLTNVIQTRFEATNRNIDRVEKTLTDKGDKLENEIKKLNVDLANEVNYVKSNIELKLRQLKDNLTQENAVSTNSLIKKIQDLADDQNNLMENTTEAIRENRNLALRLRGDLQELVRYVREENPQGEQLEKIKFELKQIKREIDTIQAEEAKLYIQAHNNNAEINEKIDLMTKTITDDNKTLMGADTSTVAKTAVKTQAQALNDDDDEQNVESMDEYIKDVEKAKFALTDTSEERLKKVEKKWKGFSEESKKDYKEVYEAVKKQINEFGKKNQKGKEEVSMMKTNYETFMGFENVPETTPKPSPKAESKPKPKAKK